MPRLELRALSLIVITAVMAGSAARVLCLLPCVVEQAGAAAHCDHAPPALSLDAPLGNCADCDEIQPAGTERLPSRHSAIAPDAITSVAPLLQAPPIHTAGIAPALKRGPSPGRAPVPLRI